MELTAHTRQWDQAEGLRRLMATRFIRTIAVMGAGNRRPDIVNGLAHALAGSGKQVLVARQEKVPPWLHDAACFRLEHNCQQYRHADTTSALLPMETAVHQLQIACPSLMSLPLLQQSDALAKLLLQLEGVNVALVSMDRQEIEEMVRVAAIVQNVIIVMQSTAEGIKEAYRRIKILSKLKAKQHFRVLINEVDNEWEAQAQYKHFAWVTSRYLHVSLEFMGWLPPRHVSMSRLAAIYNGLVKQIDQWGYPSQGAMQLEAFLYALFGSENRTATRWRSEGA